MGQAVLAEGARRSYAALDEGAAGIPPGHTLHGLRKTLGKALAEHGATTRELMDILGHDNIEHAELYSREAEQRLMASAAMEKLLTWRRPKAG
jgi:integrase